MSPVEPKTREQIADLIANADKPFDGTHRETGFVCLMDHGDEGQCIRCSCGKFVPPNQWEAHRVKG